MPQKGRSFGRREPFQIEYRLRRRDGQYRWIFDHGVARFNVEGSFAGYRLRHRCYRAQASGGGLIDAHEEERIWIAREPHDDFNQRIALLAVNLDRLSRDLPASRAPPGVT